MSYIGGNIHSGIAYTKGSWNSFSSVITDNLAMEGFKVEELVHSIVVLIKSSKTLLRMASLYNIWVLGWHNLNPGRTFYRYTGIVSSVVYRS